MFRTGGTCIFQSRSVFWDTGFLLQVFGSYESVSVQDRWHLHLPKQECILGHWFLLQVLRVMRV